MNTTHAQRISEAETEGHLAGAEYEQLIHETCPPEKWSPRAQAEWSELLGKLRTNPYRAPDAFQYAEAWDLAFKRGRTERRTTLARKTTVHT